MPPVETNFGFNLIIRNIDIFFDYKLSDLFFTLISTRQWFKRFTSHSQLFYTYKKINITSWLF